METYLSTTLEKLRSNKYSDLNIVLGNESCDLDSAVSALAYAAFLHWQYLQIKCKVCTRLNRDDNVYKDDIFVAVLNVDREDFELKTEVAFCLREYAINPSQLVFRDDYDLKELVTKTKTNITLVDHHILAKRDRFLTPYVTEIIDHRPIDKTDWRYKEDTRSTIEPPPPPPAPKSKKAKKKAKKAAAADPEPAKTDPTKMVTLRNPMFHPNLPPVQVSSAQAPKKQEQIRIPDPIPMPPNACQATITPTSNGMYTIRNPLMSMMHQQTMMGMRNPSPQLNPMYAQPQYNYVNPNVYNPVPNVPPQTYVLDPRASPKDNEFQNRIMNLASFTQKNDEGYSLFKTSEDNQQRNFLTPEFYDNPSPKPIVSPNPIGTRPANDSRSFESDSSLFANPIQRPEPIGTPLKREEERDFGNLYTPFGQEDRNVFRNALFNDKNEVKVDEGNMANGDPLPYFQRLRVGSKLNNEVTIHHVTESKFYKGQEPQGEVPREESLFSAGGAQTAWSEGLYTLANNKTAALSGRSSPTGSSLCSSGGSSPATDDAGFGAVGTRAHTLPPPPPPAPAPPAQESSVFLPDRSITNLSTLEVSEREIESFKRFEFYFEPPQHKPKVQLDVRDIAAALRHNQK